ncbi:hypothetical protein [Carnobacterium pleistocenium]|uniref:hypothetical protein n=1 Tax=Carnobacterium pleistocenium TaxID=181073 RepID=UPI000A74FB67|nr:hypothetical protein [Carnobacterium pleistocenium]
MLRMAVFVIIAVIIVFLIILPLLNKFFSVVENIAHVAEKQNLKEEKDEEKDEL